jgi:transposase
MANPVAVEIVLSEEERVALERWARRAKSAQSLALRCRIVLACAEGLRNTEVAKRLRVSRTTAAKWRNHFAEHRSDGCTTSRGRAGRSLTTTWSG